MKFLLLILLIYNNPVFSQGGIDHIKNQEYMKHSKKIDCNNLEGDILSVRICANLKYQISDSLLVIIYKKLLTDQDSDSARNYIIQLQKEWRSFRDKHCKITWFEGGSGHTNAIRYMDCLTHLTNNRRIELEMLLSENQ